MPLSAPKNVVGAASVPTEAQIACSNMAAFAASMEVRYQRQFDDYDALHRWSVEHAEEFWTGLWDHCGIVASARSDVVVEHGGTMEQVAWFPGARLNFAENLLRFRGSDDALVFWGEDQVKRRMSRDDLYAA